MLICSLVACGMSRKHFQLIRPNPLLPRQTFPLISTNSAGHRTIAGRSSKQAIWYQQIYSTVWLILSEFFSYSSSHEILAYIKNVAEKDDLLSNVHLGHAVNSARWNDRAGAWDVQVEGPGGETIEDRGHFFINGTRILKYDCHAWLIHHITTTDHC